MEDKELEVVKNELVDLTSKRVTPEILKALEEKFETKFPTMDEIKKMFETYKPNTATLSADEKQIEEVKFWQSIAQGKAAGDITDTGTAATLVPSSVADKILDQIQAAGYVRNICTVFPDDKGNLFVKKTGATAYRTAEGVAPNTGTPSVLQYTPIPYNTYEAAADIIVSNKLLAEAKPNILNFAYGQLGQAFANLERVEFITGAGTTAFFGLATTGPAGAITAVTATTGTTVATLTYDDILAVWLAVPQQ